MEQSESVNAGEEAERNGTLPRRAVFALIMLAVLAGGSRFPWGWAPVAAALGITGAILAWKAVKAGNTGFADVFLGGLLFLAATSFLYLLPQPGASPRHSIADFAWGAVRSGAIGTAAASVYLAMKLLVRRGRHFVEFFALVAITGIIAAVFGLGSLFFSGPAEAGEIPAKLFGLVPVYNMARLSGTFTNANRFCALLGMSIAALAGWASRPVKLGRSEPSGARVRTAALALAGLVLLAAAFTTMSRAGVLVTAAAGFAVSAPFLLRGGSSRARLAAFIALVLVAAQQIVFKFTGWWERIANSGPALSERLEAMRAGFLPWLHSPVTGCGPGGFPYGFLPCQPETLAGRWWQNSHCDYVTFLAERGLVGFVVGAIIIVWLGVFLWRARSIRFPHTADKLLLAAGTWMLAVPLLHSLVDFPLRDPANLWLAAAAAGALAGFISSRRKMAEGYEQIPAPNTAVPADIASRRLPAVIAALVLTLSVAASLAACWMGFVSWWMSPAPFPADTSLPGGGTVGGARRFPNTAGLSNAEISARWASAYRANPLDHRLLSAAATAAAGRLPELGEPADAADLSALPKDWYSKVKYLCANDPRPEWLSGVIALEKEDFKTAAEHFRLAALLSPGQPDIQVKAATGLMETWDRSGRETPYAIKDAQSFHRRAVNARPSLLRPVFDDLEQRGLPPERWLASVPDDRRAHLEAARLLAARGLYGLALEMLGKITEPEPAELLLKARCLGFTGDLDGCVEECVEYLERMGASDKTAANRLSALFSALRGHAGKVEMNLQEIVSRYKTVPLQWEKRLKAAHDSRENLTAAENRFWEIAAGKRLRSYPVLSARADMLFREQDWKTARSAYAALIPLAPARNELVFVRFRAALSAKMTGDTAAAITHAEKAHLGRPDDEKIIAFLAELYASVEDYTELRELVGQWRLLYSGRSPEDYPAALRRFERLLAEIAGKRR